MPGRKGFTLIELLVVIAIIALLLSIVMPALRKAKEQARLAICMYHQRQIVTAVLAYSVGNNGKYPEHVAVCKRTPNSNGLWWDSPEMMAQNQRSSNPSSSILDGGYLSEILKGYLDSVDIWFCPLSLIQPDTPLTGRDGVQRTFSEVYQNADRVNYPFVRWSFAAFWRFGGFATYSDTGMTESNKPPFYGPQLPRDPKILRPGSAGTLMISDVLKGRNNGNYWQSNHPVKGSYKASLYYTRPLTDDSFFTVDRAAMIPIISNDIGKVKYNGGYEDGHVERYTSLETYRQASRGRYFLLPKWN